MRPFMALRKPWDLKLAVPAAGLSGGDAYFTTRPTPN